MSNCDQKRNLGLLILRLGFGIMFILHGWGKLAGGEQVWIKVGSALSVFGISFAPKLFGLAAALAEFVGGICLILGLFVRPASLFLLITMIVASTMHLSHGDGIKGASHAIEAGVVFFALMLIGAGKYGLDEKLRRK